MLAFPTADQARERLHPMRFAEILDTMSLSDAFSSVPADQRSLFWGIHRTRNVENDNSSRFRITQRHVKPPTNLIVLILKILLPNASRTTKNIITSFVGGALVTTSSALYLAGHAPAQAAWRQVGKAISPYRYFKCTFPCGFVALMSFARI